MMEYVAPGNRTQADYTIGIPALRLCYPAALTVAVTHLDSTMTLNFSVISRSNNVSAA